MNDQGLIARIVEGLKSITFLKKTLLILFALALLAGIPLVIMVGSNSKRVPDKINSSEKTWEIILDYNNQQNKISLKKLTLLNKKITPDYRSAKFSSFELQVLDSSGDAIYKSKVPISTELIFNILAYPESSGSAKVNPPESINNILYAPYFENGRKIIINEDGKKILELILPAKTTYKNIIPMADAATCRPLVIALVSDNYTNFEQFHRDAQQFQQALETTEPYSSKSDIFEFRIIDNSQNLGCGTQGLRYCMARSQPQMAQIANNAYSDISKVVVIANGPFRNQKDGGVVGISSGIGGSFGVFPSNFSSVNPLTLTVARHEVLGHMVGLLYDRYVSTDSRYGLLQNGNRSNCTDNPNGESFWQTAGSNTVVQGCGNRNLYGSSTLTCGTSNSSLISGGDRISIMSAAGCGGLGFDQVEQLWIRNQILPDYQGCSNGQPTTTPVTSVPTLTSTPQNVIYKIFGYAFTDRNNNGQMDLGEGYRGANVSISGTFRSSKTTDANGYFEFINLNNNRPGNYDLKFTVLGNSTTFNGINLTDQSPVAGPYSLKISLSRGSPPVVLTPIPTATPTVTPTATPTPTAPPGQGPGGSVPTKTPTPTPLTAYECHESPNCTAGQKNLQLCPLICTPK